jgi:hypothetical protein
VRRTASTLSLVAALALAGTTARAAGDRGFSLSVVVDGADRPEYAGNGSFYVEALRGRDYELRITNPLPYRVAVALSVDGLNTIDAKHTDARSAHKWVLGPYESAVIPGWQVDGSAARRFTFTGERSSYGAWLGKTQDLGVIEAVFFRERPRPVPMPVYDEPTYERGGDSKDQAPMDAPAPPSAERKREAQKAVPKSYDAPKLSDEYAATGMGGRTSHDVEQVAIDLLPDPVARVRVRYEFRPQLVKLGVLPREDERPLARRERATGFASYCPEPPQRPY